MLTTRRSETSSPVILVADDNLYSRDILGRMLQAEGYQVIEAENGYQALSQLRAHHPAIMLLDIQMPGLNGLEVCQRMREENDDTPIIIVTAMDEQDAVEQAFTSGASDYVTKPIDWSILRHRLRRLLLTLQVMDDLETERTKLNEHRNHLKQLVDERTAELLATNQALQQEILARQEAEKQQDRLIAGLRAVIATVDDLMATPDTDTLYKRAVELAREKLGVERCAIFVESSEYLRGTYGTDMAGNTTPEHEATVPKGNNAAEQFRKIGPSEKQWLVKDATHTYWDGNEHRSVGHGWTGLSRVRSAQRSIGVFFNDAAISQTLVDPLLQEVISVYCSLLGAVIEQKSIEEALQHKSAYLSALHEATLALVQRLDLKEALETIIQRAGELVGTPHSYLEVYEPQSHELVVKIGLGCFEVDSGEHRALDEGLGRKVWQTGKIFSIEDYAHWSGRLPNPLYDNVHAMIGIPLYAGLEIVGILGLASLNSDQQFNQSEIEILTRFGELASIALHNSRLYADLQNELFERRRAEKALAHERDLLQSLMDNIPDTIYFKDTQSRFTRINDAQARILGLKEPQEALGKADFDFQPKQLSDEFYAEEQRLLATGEPILDRLEYNPTPDGQERWFSATKVAIRDRLGKIVGLVGVSRNVTEYKRMEATLRYALEKQNELNELKSRFIAMASHEFRTPLAIISSSTGIIRIANDKITIPQREQHFAKIENAIHQIVQLLDDVLALGQAEGGKLPFNPERIDIKAFCQEIVDEMQTTLSEIPVIAFSATTHSAPIWADMKLMRQIITNLISNAIKYSPLNNEIRVELSVNSELVELRVSDHGIGIPEKDLVHLFEPFHRAGNVGTIQGTGLGLAILKKAVERHAGTVKVQSQTNVGTTFIVQLPILQETIR
jgi:PAS domain S-box-containing protein